MCDDGIDYFDYAECLNDLVKTEHLRLTEDGRYVITEKGLKNSQICESSLPYSVRQRSDKNIAAYNRAALRRAQVQSRVTERENGTYTVTLALHDDVDQLMELQLMVADRPYGGRTGPAVPAGAGAAVRAADGAAVRRKERLKDEKSTAAYAAVLLRHFFFLVSLGLPSRPMGPLPLMAR